MEGREGASREEEEDTGHFGCMSGRSTDDSRKVKKLEERIKGLEEMKDTYFKNLCELED